MLGSDGCAQWELGDSWSRGRPYIGKPGREFLQDSPSERGCRGILRQKDPSAGMRFREHCVSKASHGGVWLLGSGGKHRLK